MSWRKKITDHLADILRFAAHLFIALDVIVLSCFLFWFVLRFIWRLAQYLDHILFANPWFN